MLLDTQPLLLLDHQFASLAPELQELQACAPPPPPAPPAAAAASYPQAQQPWQVRHSSTPLASTINIGKRVQQRRALDAALALGAPADASAAAAAALPSGGPMPPLPHYGPGAPPDAFAPLAAHPLAPLAGHPPRAHGHLHHHPPRAAAAAAAAAVKSVHLRCGAATDSSRALLSDLGAWFDFAATAMMAAAAAAAPPPPQLPPTEDVAAPSAASGGPAALPPVGVGDGGSAAAAAEPPVPPERRLAAEQRAAAALGAQLSSLAMSGSARSAAYRQLMAEVGVALLHFSVAAGWPETSTRVLATLLGPAGGGRTFAALRWHQGSSLQARALACGRAGMVRCVLSWGQQFGLPWSWAAAAAPCAGPAAGGGVAALAAAALSAPDGGALGGGGGGGGGDGQLREEETGAAAVGATVRALVTGQFARAAAKTAVKRTRLLCATSCLYVRTSQDARAASPSPSPSPVPHVFSPGGRAEDLVAVAQGRGEPAAAPAPPHPHADSVPSSFSSSSSSASPAGSPPVSAHVPSPALELLQQAAAAQARAVTRARAAPPAVAPGPAAAPPSAPAAATAEAAAPPAALPGPPPEADSTPPSQSGGDAGGVLAPADHAAPPMARRSAPLPLPGAASSAPPPCAPPQPLLCALSADAAAATAPPPPPPPPAWPHPHPHRSPSSPSSVSISPPTTSSCRDSLDAREGRPPPPAASHPGGGGWAGGDPDGLKLLDGVRRPRLPLASSSYASSTLGCSSSSCGSDDTLSVAGSLAAVPAGVARQGGRGGKVVGGAAAWKLRATAGAGAALLRALRAGWAAGGGRRRAWAPPLPPPLLLLRVALLALLALAAWRSGCLAALAVRRGRAEAVSQQ